MSVVSQVCADGVILCGRVDQSGGVFVWQTSGSRRQAFKENLSQARMRSEAREQFMGLDREREKREAKALRRAEERKREERLLSADDDNEADRRPS